MEAVIFVGIQATGKSTFYRERFFATHVRVSLDLLRTRHRERALLAWCLRHQQPFVVDNTNLTAAERAVYNRAMPPLLVLLLRLLLALVAAYLLLCGLLYLGQERLIFFPERDPPGTRYALGVPAEEIFIPVAGAQLHALHLRAPAPRGVILYLHGNAGSLRSWGLVAPDFVRRGYDVLIVDYRGYGQSSGQINGEAQLHQDMAAVYAYVRARYPEEQIVLYGRSLGSGLATRLAARHAPRLLILESPFFSLEVIARRQFPLAPPFLLKYPLRTHAWLGQVRCPIVIIHGRADAVVPFSDGERLRAHSAAPLTFHAIPGGGHNDLSRFAAYHAALDQALGPEL